MKLAPLSLFLSTVAVTLIGAPGYGQTQTPSEVIYGFIGGTNETECGFINTSIYDFYITEPIESRGFKVSSMAPYTLYIVGPNGFTDCIIAAIPANGTYTTEYQTVLAEGQYEVYLGNRHESKLEGEATLTVFSE